MARPSASRVSTGKVLRELRVASRRGDRAALTVALDLMRTDFEPQTWTDEYRARVMQLIDAKARGAKIAVRAAKPAPAGGGLADQLAKSLAMAKERKVA